MAKIGLQTIPPFTYAMLRLLVAVAVLAALMQGAGRLQRPARADVPIVISYGLLAIAAGIGIMNLALPFVEAGRASILAYTLPLWVVPIVAVVARTLPTRPELTGLVLGLAGLVLLLNPAAIDWSSPQVLLGLRAAAAGRHGGRRRARPRARAPLAGHAVRRPDLAAARGHRAPGALAVLLERDEWATVDWDLGTLLVILYSGALATAFAFWASQSIVRTIGPTTTSIGYLAVPVAGILTGVLVLGEPVGLLDMLGLAGHERRHRGRPASPARLAQPGLAGTAPAGGSGDDGPPCWRSSWPTAPTCRHRVPRGTDLTAASSDYPRAGSTDLAAGDTLGGTSSIRRGMHADPGTGRPGRAHRACPRARRAPPTATSRWRRRRSSSATSTTGSPARTRRRIPVDYFEPGGLASQLAFQEAKIAAHLATYDDVYVPFLFPWYGTVVVPSALGCAIELPARRGAGRGGPAITEPSQVARLVPPDPERDGLMPRVLPASTTSARIPTCPSASRTTRVP